MANRPLLIVFQGASASGKTTLVRAVGERLSVGHLEKDDIKELLYDTVGRPPDRQISRDYGAASIKALYTISKQLLSAGVSHIISGPFESETATKEIEQMRKDVNAQVVQVFCQVTPEVSMERFNRRLAEGSRHPFHPDKPAKDLSEVEAKVIRVKPLGISDTIIVDTAQAFDDCVDEIVSQVKSITKEGDHEATN